MELCNIIKNPREHLRAYLLSPTGRLHLNITIVMYSYQKYVTLNVGSEFKQILFYTPLYIFHIAIHKARECVHISYKCQTPAQKKIKKL